MTIPLLLILAVIGAFCAPTMTRTWWGLVSHYAYQGKAAVAFYLWFAPALIGAGLILLWVFWGDASALKSIAWPAVMIVIVFAVMGGIAQIGIRPRHEPPREIAHADGRRAIIVSGRYRRLPETPTKPSLLERVDRELGLED